MYSFLEIISILESQIKNIDLNSEPKLLYRPIEYLLEAGGKRVRPSLVMMAHNLYCDDVTKSVDVAIAIELFHNFTLLHDDIMDNAPVRRGRATANYKWDDNVAILSGDAAIIMAYQYLAKCNTKHLSEVMQIFNKFALEVCDGQRYDMNFEQQQNVYIEDYIEMIRLKTSVLLAGSMAIGGTIGDASKSDIDKLYGIGESLGLAFQLSDDYLDSFGDEATFGKRIGGDIIEGKKTFLYITTLQSAPESRRDEIVELFNNNNISQSEKIEKVKSLYVEFGADLALKNLVNQYYEKSIELLEQLDVAPQRKSHLRDLIKAIIIRKK